MSNQYGQYRAATRHRTLVTAFVEFTGANGASPSVINDPTGVLAATGGVTRTGEGVYSLNLRHDWKAIYPVATVVSSTAGDMAQVSAVTETAGAQAVVVLATLDLAGVQTADDLDGVVFKVRLDMHLSDDA